MGNIHLVTGYAGRAHVTSADHASLFMAAIRSGEFVTNAGQKFAALVISNNIVRISDGELVMQGRHAKLDSGSHVDLTIENGAQGYSRVDLIVARYTREAATGIEDCNLVVIKGTPAESDPVAPSYTTADINSDDTLLAEMPLYTVPISGYVIGTPTALFTTQAALRDEVLWHINNQSNPHVVTKAQVGLGNVPNVSTNDQAPTYSTASTLATLTSGEKLSVAFGKIKKAITELISHKANTSNPHSVTAAQAGAVPTSRTVNSKALSANITLSASDVGAVAAAAGTANNGKFLRVVNGVATWVEIESGEGVGF